jgi:hypothetical protein
MHILVGGWSLKKSTPLIQKYEVTKKPKVPTPPSKLILEKIKITYHSPPLICADNKMIKHDIKMLQKKYEKCHHQH